MLDAAVPALEAAGCDTPRLDAELLLADTLEVDRAVLAARPERELPRGTRRLAAERIRRRRVREPVAYILGRKGFRHVEVAVDPRVLIPRPETELLVEVALEQPEGARVHDVGTGSGAIALALRDERPDLMVSASDASPAAVEVARLNGVYADLAGPPAGRLRPRGGQPSLRARGRMGPPGARRPPVRAARGAGVRGGRPGRHQGADGPGAGGHPARPGARADQAEAVRSLLDGAETRRDLAGRERVTVDGRAEPRGRGDVRALHRGGRGRVFPADTVYGLATEPDSKEAVAG